MSQGQYLGFFIGHGVAMFHINLPINRQDL